MDRKNRIRKTARLPFRAMLPALLLCLALAGGCAAPDPEGSDSGSQEAMEYSASDSQEASEGSGESAAKEVFAMDTYMTVTVYGEGAAAAADAAIAEIERIDAALSTGSEDSQVSRLNREGTGTLSADGCTLLESSLDLYQMTGGLFDISIYPVMELWGFPSGQYHVPTPAELAEALALVDASDVFFNKEKKEVRFAKQGMKIDFGGIAKGFTSDRLSELLREKGIGSALVNLGGNVQAIGPKPDGSSWRVGIQDPAGGESLAGVLSVRDKAVITSGGYERYFEEDGHLYHHIIDPRTGRPAESGLLSVTIVSENGMLADGLSTSLFIMGKDEAIRFWEKDPGLFDMILVCEDGQILITEGLEGSFTSDNAFRVIA